MSQLSSAFFHNIAVKIQQHVRYIMSFHLSPYQPNSVHYFRTNPSPQSSLEVNSTPVFLSWGEEREPYESSGKTLVPLQNAGSGLHLIT